MPDRLMERIPRPSWIDNPQRPPGDIMRQYALQLERDLEDARHMRRRVDALVDAMESERRQLWSILQAVAAVQMWGGEACIVGTPAHDALQRVRNALAANGKELIE